MIEAEDLYDRLHSLSKSLECRGRLDEHDNPDAYKTVLDAMSFVMSEQEPRYTAQDVADACMAAEIPDSKCESLLIALKA